VIDTKAMPFLADIPRHQATLYGGATAMWFEGRETSFAEFGPHAEWTDFTAWRDAQSTTDPKLPHDGEDDVLQLYTSGTTENSSWLFGTSRYPHADPNTGRAGA